MDNSTKNIKTIKNVVAIITFAAAASSFSPVLIKVNINEMEDTVLVDRDGNKYPVKRMSDNNFWMTANLKVEVPNSYCYLNIKENCDRYGRLYTWESAQEGCNMLGEGWRLPTNSEWEQLARSYGFPEDSIDYKKGAYKTLLYGGSAGFNVLLGGNRAPDGKYQRLDAHGFYWTATENDKGTAWLYNFGKGAKFLNRHNDSEKSRAASVRCVKKPNT